MAPSPPPSNSPPTSPESSPSFSPDRPPRRIGGQRPPSPALTCWSASLAPDREPVAPAQASCRMGSRSRPATSQSVREILLTVPDVAACPLCRPDSELGLLDR
ncbi:DUF6233 domain-containing protein [Streptomyces virginiae]|uniref:DUF6233 domain-containing protein n=1 Tax=Streptomyces virginiae TaxID=1961 RepID=UPI00364B28F7